MTAAGTPDDLIDLHAHYLPWVDDGARDLHDALALAKAAELNGVRETVLTPHLFPGRWENTLDSLGDAFRAFCAAARSAGIGMRFHLGAEMHLLPEALELLAAGRVPVIGRWRGRPLVLLELPDGRIPPHTEDALDFLSRQGIAVMIAHPERNKDVMRDPTRAAAFAERGCLLQLTAASVCGWFGPAAHAAAQRLLDEGWAHVIASDAHNLAHRPPVMADAYVAIEQGWGAARARQMMVETPQEIVQGRDADWL